MKKTYFFTLIFAVFISVSMIGQNMVMNGDLESWTAGAPDSWSSVENITQEATIVYTGDYSARHQSASGTQDFGHETITGIVAGGTYILSYYFMDNDPNAKTRIWSKWQDAGGSQVGDVIESDYSSDSPDWQEYNETFIAPVGAVQFYLEVRVYKEATEGGYVYYDEFSLIHDQNVYPEPTNYPTAFAAAANGLSVELTWVDAVGTQLPTGYIILGEEGTSVTDVPVDGVPVENDIDWSDGKASMNVAYGQLSYIFSALATSSTYTFAIYPYTNTGSEIDYKTDGTAPSTSSTTSNVSQLLGETFDSDLGVFTHYSVTGTQEWEWASYGNPPGCAKMSGFAGGAVENQDWLISPMMNMVNYTNITFSFDHARNYASNDNLFVMISNDYDGTSDPNDAEWIDITSGFTFPDGGWDFIEAGTVDITSYGDEETFVAFVYNSDNADAATWEIDNAEIFGVIGTGIADNLISEITVYPNPATNIINLNSDISGSATVYSISGQILINTDIEKGLNTIGVENLPTGIYIIETVNIDGVKSIGKFSIK